MLPIPILQLVHLLNGLAAAISGFLVQRPVRDLASSDHSVAVPLDQRVYRLVVLLHVYA